MHQLASPILEARDVRRRFSMGEGAFRQKSSHWALDGVSLSLRKGEVLALVGESGSGKSTTAKLLLGLDSPTSGEILVNGTRIESLSRKSLAKIVQPVFQDPYSSLNPQKVVGSTIGLPLAVQGRENSAGRRRLVESMMDQVGLPRSFYSRYPNQLSGGQRQRVAIARALITRPSVVICDEPTSALDVSVQAQILNLLQDLRHEYDLTYLLISHNLAVVRHIATRVAVMHLGKIVEQGLTEDVFGSPSHSYTRALLDSVLPPVPEPTSQAKIAPGGRTIDRHSSASALKCESHTQCKAAKHASRDTASADSVIKCQLCIEGRSGRE